MSAFDSQEFRLAEALIHYANVEPEHKYGICFWLLEQQQNGWYVDNPAMMFTELMLSGIITSETKYFIHISEQSGFTELRAAAARKVVEMLENGTITYHNGWCIDGELV